MTKQALTIAGITFATLYGAQIVHGFVARTPAVNQIVSSADWLPALLALVALYCLLP